MALLSAVDSIIIKTTFNQVLLQDEIVSWILAILTALGGALLMGTAGFLVAAQRVYPDRVRPVFITAAIVAWTALGAGLFWLRWNAATLAGNTVTVEGQTSNDTSTHGHQLMAVVMIAVYMLPGVLALIDGFRFGNPIEAHQRRTHANLLRLAPLLAAIEAEAVKVHQLLRLHADEIVLIDTRLAETKNAHASFAAELRALAREEINRRLGTPTAADINHPDEQPPTRRQDKHHHDTRGTYPNPN